MDRIGNLKQRIVLALHRQLIKLRLVKDPWRNRQTADSTREIEASKISMENVHHLTIEQPGNVTVKNPNNIVENSSKQWTIKRPDQVIIGSNSSILVDSPTSVTVQDREFVIYKHLNGQPRRVVPGEIANKSNPIVFPHLNCVSFTNAGEIII